MLALTYAFFFGVIDYLTIDDIPAGDMGIPNRYCSSRSDKHSKRRDVSICEAQIDRCPGSTLLVERKTPPAYVPAKRALSLTASDNTHLSVRPELASVYSLPLFVEK
jgi:hypothetical protein